MLLRQAESPAGFWSCISQANRCELRLLMELGMYFMPGGKLEVDDAEDKYETPFGKLLVGGDRLLVVTFLLMPRLGKGVCISESIDG